MKISVTNLRLPVSCGYEELKEAAAKKIGISTGDIKEFKIVKESIDARRKPDISRVYSIVAGIDTKIRIGNNPDVKIFEEATVEDINPGTKQLEARPVVVGSGPAGVFAGLLLAQHGYKPLMLERGACVEERKIIVGKYWENGVLDVETNVQFGEGGAGTFSDGKLTTRINDRRCERVLEEFYRSGAHEEILYKAKPHIGSDVLTTVTANMRRRIQELGGEIRFHSKVTSLLLNNGQVKGVVINGNEQIQADVVIMAIGHSARDTFEALLQQGIVFEQKPFSIGARIEHLQEMVDRAQFGGAAGQPSLGTADYQLFDKTGSRTAYSFCMCPGGIVVAAASEQGSIVTNGMSEFARDRQNANSALVVSVEPGDYGSSHPLAGVEFQRKWEQLAYKAGGSSGAAPVQRLGDFLEGRVSGKIGAVKPSYTGNILLADLNTCLPSFVTESMKQSVKYFDRKLKGFANSDAILTGVETRTSSPVRIPRGDTLEAKGINGLYPAGEGAGYAGGIVSAAVDGLRIAEQIIRTYAQPNGL